MTKVLLDHSVMTNCSRMHWTNRPMPHPQGGFFAAKLIVAERVHPFANPVHEEEAEAILAVGRLIHQKKVVAFTSMELKVEGLRDFLGMEPLDAFARCEVQFVPNAVERSRFVQAALDVYVRKGGKRDGEGNDNRFSQIAFFEWLCSLSPEAVTRIIEQRAARNLSDFDCESLLDLEWFKGLNSRLRNREDLPDAFHLWTAIRNRLDVFLTLDHKLIRKVESINREKSGFRIAVQVLSPREFLKREGIAEPAPYPCKPGVDYLMADICRIENNCFEH